jgi:Tfp pilus assembly protein FimV
MSEPEITPVSPAPAPAQEAQLTQVKVPIEQAADAFAERDASGRIPVVVVPLKPSRIRNQMVIGGVVLIGIGIEILVSHLLGQGIKE